MNLIAVIGRKIEVQEVKKIPKAGVFLMDHQFVARYRILQTIYGRFSEPEITFTVYDHYGPPAFAKHKTVLLYLSWYEGKWVHQKYLFQPVYATSDGRWASCGDPYDGMPEVHRRNVKEERVDFKPPVTFSLVGLSPTEIDRKFPELYYSRESQIAKCVRGNYAPELFQVMMEGYLRARGVLDDKAN